MASNYPPGVTGNEPHLTGEVDFNPHMPFWIGDHPEYAKVWVVYYRDGEGLWFTDPTGKGWQAQEAQKFAEMLNAAFPESECEFENHTCRICGDRDDWPEEER